jgi:DNA-directed RNA polymerase specialized sigma24 family protein
VTVAQRFLRGIHSLPDEPPADVETLRRETNSALLAGLATLPADARAALLMASQGFSGREIAEAVGKSEMATRTMMFRAREKLRVHLVREGVHS